MGEIIVTTTETIPGRKIVEVLGPLWVKIHRTSFTTEEGTRKNVLEKIKQQAAQMGADAIICFKFEKLESKWLGTSIAASGDAVKLASRRSKK